MSLCVFEDFDRVGSNFFVREKSEGVWNQKVVKDEGWRGYLHTITLHNTNFLNNLTTQSTNIKPNSIRKYL